MELVSMRMPFGKYRGRILCDLPEPYLIWFHRKGFPPGNIGMLLSALYEIELNGLEYLLKPIRKKPWCRRKTENVIYTSTSLIITSICSLVLIRSSFLFFDSLLTLLSTASAKLLLPNFFWKTNVRGLLPRRYFAPIHLFSRCSANLRATLVVIPVYKLPSLHLNRYKYQSDIVVIYFQYSVTAPSSYHGNDSRQVWREEATTLRCHRRMLS